MAALINNDGELDTIMKQFVDSFVDSKELEEFAEMMFIEDSEYVKRRLLELRHHNIQASRLMELDIPPTLPQSSNSTTLNNNKQTDISHPHNTNTPDIGFTCNVCNKKIKHKPTFHRHMKSHEKIFKCFLCNMKFNREDNLRRHERGHLTGYVKPNNQYKCQHCALVFNNYTKLFEHDITNHPRKQTGGGILHQTSSEDSLDDAVHVLKIYPTDQNKYDLLTFLADIRESIAQHLADRCGNMKHLKWYLNVHVEFIRETNDGEIDTSEPYFKSKTYILLSNDENTEHEINEAYQKQFSSFDEYIARGSGWTLKQVMHMEVHTIQYRPIGGSSYFPLPDTLKGNKSITNIKNLNDQKCFLWSVLAAIHPMSRKQNPNQVRHYIHFERELNMKGISYPVQIGQIHKFEEQNDISINVLGYEDADFFPIYISKYKDKTHQVDLLYLTKKDQNHYCCIRNLNKLLWRTKCKGRAYKFCRNCFQGFTSQNVLDKHLTYCSQYEAQHLKFPTEGDGDIVEFDDFSKQMKVPFVIYAHFEAFARKVDACLPNPSTSNTTATIAYESCGYGYQVVSSDPRYTKPPVIYRGPNAAQHLLEELFKEEEYIREKLDLIEPLTMTEDDELTFQQSNSCHICADSFTRTSGKVRDHDHLSGKFRGAACSNCNIHFQYPAHIPVFFHNLRGFDSHLLMQGIGFFKHKRINVIPNNMEKYVSFSLGHLRFLDSYQFLPNSLSGLVEDLANENPDHFKLLHDEFPNDNERSLLLRKGVYPYTWMDCEDKFNVNSLPFKESFYDDLSKSNISEEDYKHAQTVWDTFNIQNMGQYHDLYLKSDVLLLGCIFERFRDECMFNYGLDPAHFYTSPGLAWSASLKMSKCRLELITDPDMYLFVEAGMRGGISQISNRLATANNKYMQNTYDPSKESSYLIYQDCNNLYGHSMSMPLPTGDFKFLTEEETGAFDVILILPDADKGYMLEVDLEYPQELHDPHSDYPLAPETKIVADDMLSPYSKELWTKINPSTKVSTNVKSRVKTPKLLTTLEHKTKYVCHYRNLQLYLQLGMKLKNVHRILKFTQSPFLKEYIELNTRRRQAAKGEFQKSFFKLMNNNVFGKTMENLRNRVNVQLIHTKKKLLKQVAKSSFERCQIFNKDLVGVQLKKTVLTLNKSIIVGMSILEISKVVMYDHHYNYVLQKYGHTKAKLMMTDTDSLLYHITTKDLYEDMAGDKHLFDFSNYAKDHPLYDSTNAKKPGLFKDETAGVPIMSFAGLRSKMYSIKYDDVEQKRAKGIVKSVVKKDLKHQQYIDCILASMNIMCQMNVIRSHTHKLRMLVTNKLGLCAFDDKRYILDSGTETLAFGHYRISPP